MYITAMAGGLLNVLGTTGILIHMLIITTGMFCSLLLCAFDPHVTFAHHAREVSPQPLGEEDIPLPLYFPSDSISAPPSYKSSSSEETDGNSAPVDISRPNACPNVDSLA